MNKKSLLGSVNWTYLILLLSLILVIGGAFALYLTKGQKITI